MIRVEAVSVTYPGGIAALGFGALPGVLALGLHSIGMVGKFFAESIEHVDEAPVEAVRATGVPSFGVLWHGVLPQVIPQFADVSIYRWEYNFRASTVMGMVGAGGIGFELMGSLRIMDYREVSAILLLILAMVTVVDAFSSHLRRLSMSTRPVTVLTHWVHEEVIGALAAHAKSSPTRLASPCGSRTSVPAPRDGGLGTRRSAGRDTRRVAQPSEHALHPATRLGGRDRETRHRAPRGAQHHRGARWRATAGRGE